MSGSAFGTQQSDAHGYIQPGSSHWNYNLLSYPLPAVGSAYTCSEG